ncbi:hypothetical protein C0J52_14631 [Blattella germanica]|nr:hypothetical protein C0J52_14631 [Blattella germanica]
MTGRSFGGKGDATNRMFLEASLNGSILDTDVVCFTEEPLYDAELIWESSKKSLRRLRTCGGNIKVQCFLVDGSQTKKQRLGHFVISLREAHVVPNGKSFEEIGESWWRWQKLNGPKPPYPELLCCLRLEEKKVDPQLSSRAEWHSFSSEPLPDLEHTNTEEKTANMQVAPIAEETWTRNSPRKQNLKSTATNPNFVTRLHSDKGVIQIGSDKTAIDYFTLTIYVGQALNLDLLLSGNYKAKDPPEDEQVFLHYNVMDFAANTATISLNDIQKPVSLNEKMVISLHSSLTNLERYFSVNSKLFMKLMISDQEVGFGELLMQGLVPTTNREQFCGLQEDNSVTIESSCFLRGSVTKEVPMSPSGLEPYVQLRFKLRFEETEQTPLIRSNSYTVLNASKVQDVPVIEIQDEDDFFEDPVSEGVRETKSMECRTMTRIVQEHLQASGDVPQDGDTTELLKEVKAHSGQTHMSVSASDVQVNKETLSEKSQAPTRTCHAYALNIRVQSIGLRRIPIQKKCFFQTKRSERSLIHVHFFTIHKNQSTYTTQLIDPKTSEDVGMLKVTMVLKDGGPQNSAGENVLQNMIPGIDLGTAVLNDKLAYKIVEELEDWKERQEILFKAELKKKEQAHLAKLTAEWEQRRNEIEKNLNQNVEQCRTLAQSLNEATEELRENKATEEKLEAALKSKSFFKEQWATAVRQLHHYKADSQQAIEIQIRKNKEDMENLGLQHLLAHGEYELREDKDQLKRLRLQVCKLQGSQVNLNQASPRYIPGTSSMHSLHSAAAAKTTSSTNSTSRRQNEIDEEIRLQALMEERDVLMENGCPLEDPNITKLNKEIRTLLLNSNKETAFLK